MNHKFMEMYMNGSENEFLFSKLVPVSMKDVYTNQSRNTHLFLTMEWQEASSGMYSKKLSISLTDNEDPYFLYNMQLNEEEFQILKTSQELLINFASFPEHIINYIENCLLEEKNPQPKFLLVFIRSSNPSTAAQIDIVETNQFKNLTHLSLKFNAAQESAVRQYVNSTFRNLKDERRRLQNSLSNLEQELKEKLTNSQHALNSKVQELDLVRKEYDAVLLIKDNEHKRQLQEETDKLKREHHDKLNRLEKEIAEKEYNFRKEIQKLESNLQSLEHHNKKLHDMNLRNEDTIRELKSNVNFHEDETRRLKENLQSFELKCKSLQCEIRDKVSHICQQEEIVSDLQQELRSKEHSISKLNDRLESEVKLKKSLEKQLYEMKFKFESSEVQRKEVEKDAEKLNTVVIELQKNIKVLEKENKTKEQQIVKYKKVAEEKQKALQDIEKQIGNLNNALESKKLEIKSLIDAKSTLQQKLEEARKCLHEKETLNKYLQKELTERCIVLPYVPPPHLKESPSALAEKQLSGIRSQSSSGLPGQNGATKSVSFSMSGILGESLKNRNNIASMQKKQLFSFSLPKNT